MSETVEARTGADRVLSVGAGVRPGERLLVLRDERGDRELQAVLAAAGTRAGAEVTAAVAPAGSLSADATEAELLAAVPASWWHVDVLIGVTGASVYHSALGRRLAARGGRVLAMTGCTMATLTDGALNADFPSLGRQIEALERLLEAGSSFLLTTPAGTELAGSIAGRPAHACSGRGDRPGDRTGFPDVEAFIAPVEGAASGRVVVDASTTSLGVLAEPLELEVRDGVVTGISGARAAELETLLAPHGPGGRVVAELGLGLNPSARIVGRIIEDEAVLGTAHIALGDNAGFGGTNVAGLHEDFVLREATLSIDGGVVIDRGRHIYPH